MLSPSRYSWHRFQLKRRSTNFVRAPFFDGNTAEGEGGVGGVGPNPTAERATSAAEEEKAPVLQQRATAAAEEEEKAPVLQQRVTAAAVSEE